MRLVRNSDLTYSALRLELFPMFSLSKSYRFWDCKIKSVKKHGIQWKLQSTNSAFFVVTTTTLPHAHSFCSSSLYIFPRSFQAKKIHDSATNNALFVDSSFPYSIVFQTDCEPTKGEPCREIPIVCISIFIFALHTFINIY